MYTQSKKKNKPRRKEWYPTKSNMRKDDSKNMAICQNFIDHKYQLYLGKLTLECDVITKQ